MAVDYDLVVIGSSQEGIYAATIATYFKARVALVTQTDEGYITQKSQLNNYTLGEISRFLQQGYNWGFWETPAHIPLIDLSEVKEWSNLVKSTLEAENSLASLAALGVDIISGRGKFLSEKEEVFSVGNRILFSRSFLIATSAYYSIEQILGRDLITCLTPDSFWSDVSSLGNNLTIIGGSFRSLELAQYLGKLGKQISLVVKDRCLLSQEDLEVTRYIQAQLEIDGVTIFPNSSIDRIKKFKNKVFVQISDRAIETDGIIFANYSKANIDDLNLKNVGVKYLPRGIIVNDRFQTTNKNIYACGNVLGGDSLPHVSRYEVNIAIENILFAPFFKKDYRYIPQVLLTQPSFARVGMSEAKAKKKYNSNVYIVKEYFKSISQSQVTANVTGWCKFIVNNRGEIIGATIIGDRATELISTVSILMQHKIKLSSNSLLNFFSSDMVGVSPGLSEILSKVSLSLNKQRLEDNKIGLNLLQKWLNLKRNWHK